MALELDTATDIEGSNFLSKGDDGTYHLCVIDTNESPKYRAGKKKDQYIDGFEIQVEVMAGPKKGYTTHIVLQNPNLSHKDGGEFAKKLQTRMLTILGLLNKSQFGQKVSITLKDAEGMQFIGSFKTDTSADGGQFLTLDGARFWHIDDPAAAKCERCATTIALLPQSFRRSPESFAKADAAKGGANGNGNGSKSSQPARPPVNVDDL